MYYGYYEEGDRCPECAEKHEQGVLRYNKPQNCSCHISPPCGACTSARLECDNCGWEDDSEEEKYVPTEFEGLSQRIVKPRPFDNTKVDYRSRGHTNSSMIKEGVYPLHMDIREVEKEVTGTFGGRFESFKDGKFKYIAYTD